jgi:signal transduction histidine kinase
VITRLRVLAAPYLDRLPRPLDPLRSIKLKLGIALLGSGAAGMCVFWYALGYVPAITSLVAIVVALVTSQVLAHGMTAPLREMTAAARAMSRGDYSRSVQVTSRDEVGELGRAFNRMAADLAAEDQRRRELIGNVSHELRTPISALRAVLENVVDGVAEPDPRTLRSALAQTERLGKLVTELLDLSRLDGGAAPLRPTEFSVAEFLADAVAQAGVGSDTTVRVEVRPPELRAVADPDRLHQVIANLLANALRHGPRDGEIRVCARPGPGESGLLLEVADQGPGIPPEQRTRVFERFTSGGTRDGDGGTGLGLAIARWAVGLHGGSIAVVGDGPGCRIRVLLP